MEEGAIVHFRTDASGGNPVPSVRTVQIRLRCAELHESGDSRVRRTSI